MFIVSNYSKSCAFITFFIVNFYEKIQTIFLKNQINEFFDFVVVNENSK